MRSIFERLIEFGDHVLNEEGFGIIRFECIPAILRLFDAFDPGFTFMKSRFNLFG